VLNLVWTFRWLSAVAFIESFGQFVLVPLLSLKFGWLHGVNDQVSLDKDGSWSEV